MPTFDTLRPDGTAGSITVVENSGDGLEGVLLVTADRRACVKCFRQDDSVALPAKMDKIQAMLSPRFDKFRALGRQGIKDPGLGGFTWPIFSAFDSSLARPGNPQGFVGYGMPFLADTHELSRFHVLNNGISETADMADRYRISANLSFLFELAHRKSMCIGDARPGNIRIRRSGPRQWQVHIIDTDSFQITERNRDRVRTYTGDVGDHEYSSPRLMRQVNAQPANAFRNLKRVPGDDLHALAVICFQNLMGGFHPLRAPRTRRTVAENAVDLVFPFAGTPTVKASTVARYKALPDDMRTRFENAFLREDYAPAREWMEALEHHAQRLAAAKPAPVPRAPTPAPVPAPAPVRKPTPAPTPIPTALRDALQHAEPAKSGKTGVWIFVGVAVLTIAIIAAAVLLGV